LQLPAQDSSDDGFARRLSEILGPVFARESVAVHAEKPGMCLTGYAGLPTMNRPTAAQIYLFVNGRPVRDRQLLGAVRAGYQDMLPRGRHPVLVLFLRIETESVDVNVHPAKAEVRFRDSASVRGLFVGALSSALRAAGMQATKEGGEAAMRKFAHAPSFGNGGASGLYPFQPGSQNSRLVAQTFQQPSADFFKQAPPQARYEAGPDSLDKQTDYNLAGGAENLSGYPLGAAKAQLHKTYIVAETSLVFVLSISTPRMSGW